MSCQPGAEFHQPRLRRLGGDGALLTAIAVTGLSIGARFYMPRALNRALSEYGSVGAVFVIFSWLIVICVASSIGITAGAVAAQQPLLAPHLGTAPSAWQKGT
ncbi:hypothetical protein [Streptomyces sp. SLBN-118]|uniref:hypothetical protein n=1 Tax=Streptomyces sp. SLBN-118 TaxID=2768454 RepID=UPI00135A2FBB|nr:hypothetical protein [Streptomyces sp. SLBN-118]